MDQVERIREGIEQMNENFKMVTDGLEQARRDLDHADARIQSMGDALGRCKRIAAMGLTPSADRAQALEAILSIAEEQSQ